MLSRVWLFATPPGSSVHGIFQTILECVAISFSIIKYEFVQIFCYIFSSTSLGYIPESMIPRPEGKNIYKLAWHCQISPLIRVETFCFPTSNIWEFLFLHTTHRVFYQISRFLTEKKWSHSNWHSYLISKTEHLFLCLGAICMVFSKTLLVALVYFLLSGIGLFLLVDEWANIPKKDSRHTNRYSQNHSEEGQWWWQAYIEPLVCSQRHWDKGEGHLPFLGQRVRLTSELCQTKMRIRAGREAGGWGRWRGSSGQSRPFERMAQRGDTAQRTVQGTEGNR